MLDGRSEALPVSELAGGARIRHIYQDIFVKGLEAMNPSRCPPPPLPPPISACLAHPRFALMPCGALLDRNRTVDAITLGTQSLPTVEAGARSPSRA